ncbi:MAG: CDP-glucose 4,6-dehydratase [Chitinophagaceae bacterium]
MEGMVMLRQLQSFYEGKKVFVTGHTGFKGTWLTAILNKLGAQVKGYALQPEDSKPFNDLFKPFAFDSVIADIRDRKRLNAEIQLFQPDYIFHLAAQPLVLRAYEIPAETFEVNVVGTSYLLEALFNLNKKCTVVVVTTDKVYENKEQDVLYNETDRLGGHDPYSASKACTEIVVESFRSSFFNPDEFNFHQKAITSARAGNVIGGGDWSKNRIIPDTARALLTNQPILVRNPDSVRPWQHVLEPLCGYLLLAGQLYQQPINYSKPFNFGPYPKDHLTVRELVELAIEVWGEGRIEVGDSANSVHEANLLQLDITRVLSELKWQPKLNAREAIQWTMEWYKTDISKQANFTFSQIDNYLAK